jgi:diamine N-acetyltransferase
MKDQVLNNITTINIEIRPATINDYEAICLHFKELDALHVALLPDNFREFEGPARPIELFDEMIKTDDRVLFIACNGEHVAGFVDVRKSANPPYPMFLPKDFALIENLYVHSEFRGTGLAHKLFEKAKMWAKEQGFSNLQLKVYNKNEAAIRFYQKEGLVPLSTTFEVNI